MEIRVLGPLAVVSPAGDNVVIGSAKQRELLALLAAHAPRIVSKDRIVDALWGDDGSDHLSSLRFHISKLRDALDPDRTENLIVTQPPGYGLGASAESVDANRFAALVTRSERLSESDPIKALTLLEQALGLWRGAPYSEFEYAEWARQEVLRLEELRLIAIELRVDADLAMGRDGGLVPELESLVVQHPLREHLWRQLMVALYRSDRQPEALRAYQRACHVFAELGTCPSADLEQLERQILLRDPLPEPASFDAMTLGNLPALVSSFVGRGDEVVMVREHVAAHRLVTLLGPGGVGKTRLAIETARGMTGRFTSGTWLVELAGVDDAGLVASQVAGALGVFEGPGDDLPARLVAHLRGRNALLVLDNCEHLIGAVAALIAELLACSPRLHILATSRRRLGVDGEATWRTAPLSLEPDHAAASGIDVPAATDAVQLFFDRAQSAQPSLEVTSEAETLALDVCRRLAGLPLAIELAAARLHMMSLHHLSERLDDEFELLSDGSAEAVGHHRAMRATLDWSYGLLDPLEQAMFRRLAVFRGGFTLEAVERFHQLLPAAEGTALQLLGRLVDASMVESSSDDRFKMLEPIRHYGLIVLSEHGEASAAGSAHGLVYREMFPMPDSDLFGNPFPPRSTREQFVSEMDNVRVALSRAFDSGDLATAVELGTAAGCHFYGVGYLAEASQWLGRVLSASSEATAHRARALSRAAFITGVLDGPDSAEPLVRELEATAEALQDDRWRAAAMERRALLALFADDVEEAARRWDQAARLLLDLEDAGAQVPLSNHMEALYYAGDYESADVVAEQLADLGRQFDIPELIGSAFIGRSFIAVWRGDADSAERYFSAAADYFGGAIQFDSYGSMFIPGFIALLRGDLDEAERLGAAVMSVARESRHPDSFYRGLVLMGLVHFHRGHVEVGHRYLVEALRDASRVGLAHFKRYVLGPTAATWAMVDPPRGAVLIAAVEANNDRDHRTMPAPVNQAIREATAALEESLTRDEFEQAWSRGTAMTLEEAVALAIPAN